VEVHPALEPIAELHHDVQRGSSEDEVDDSCAERERHQHDIFEALEPELDLEDNDVTDGLEARGSVCGWDDSGMGPMDLGVRRDQCALCVTLCTLASLPPVPPPAVLQHAAKNGLQPLVIIVQQSTEGAAGLHERFAPTPLATMRRVDAAEHRHEEVVDRHGGIGVLHKGP